jgi:hypothetical protein
MIRHHINKRSVRATLALLGCLAVGTGIGAITTPAQAAPCHDPLNGCPTPRPTPQPPKPISDTYCCDSTRPLYKRVRVRRGKKMVEVQVLNGWQGQGCRAINNGTNCDLGEDRLHCEGYGTEILTPQGGLECSH